MGKRNPEHSAYQIRQVSNPPWDSQTVELYALPLALEAPQDAAHLHRTSPGHRQVSQRYLRRFLTLQEPEYVQAASGAAWH